MPFFGRSHFGFIALSLGFWRLERRFGAPALAAALPVICIYGAIRDHRVAARTGLLEFAPGFPVAIADGLLEWGVPFLVAVAISACAFRGRRGATP